MRDQLVAAGHDVAGAAGELSGELASEAVPLGTGDLGALGALVRTLVAAHLRDARIDVFATGGETGYFTFGSLLSWLWYDFSHDLASVRVKYCARCGRGFSVAGHRGPERNYCSAACRNAAHNRRSRRVATTFAPASWSAARAWTSSRTPTSPTWARRTAAMPCEQPSRAGRPSNTPWTRR